MSRLRCLSRATVLSAACLLTPMVLGCDMLRDAPFLVTAWSPGSACQDITPGISVSLSFSGSPCQSSVESSFSLTEDGAIVAGICSWEGSTLTFLPYAPLRSNAEYRVSVSEDAMDCNGVSLERRFEQRFSTRAETERPDVVSSDPGDGGTMASPDGAVSITFSEAIDERSYRDCLSISPGIRGVWRLDSTGSIASFSPMELWEQSAEYTLTISPELADRSANALGMASVIRFSVGQDHSPPLLLSMYAIDADGECVMNILPDTMEDAVRTVNGKWEASWRLLALFDEPVEASTVERRFTCDGGYSLELEPGENESDTMVFRFAEKPAWGDTVAIQIGKGIEDLHGNPGESEITVYIHADGPSSSPPLLLGVRIPLAPGEILPADRKLAAFSLQEPYATILLASGETGYPPGVAVETSIELYIDTALGAGLDAVSIMESFRSFSSNGALDFSARKISLSGLDYAPPFEQWDACLVARVDGTLVNHVDTGIFTVSLAAGLRDTAGNTSVKAQSLVLLK